MHFETHELVTKRFVAHILPFMSRKCRCAYFVSHNR